MQLLFKPILSIVTMIISREIVPGWMPQELTND